MPPWCMPVAVASPADVCGSSPVAVNMLRVQYLFIHPGVMWGRPPLVSDWLPLQAQEHPSFPDDVILLAGRIAGHACARFTNYEIRSERCLFCPSNKEHLVTHRVLSKRWGDGSWWRRRGGRRDVDHNLDTVNENTVKYLKWSFFSASL